jgi:RNA polymerase sigma factor (sigma-70 family)
MYNLAMSDNHFELINQLVSKAQKDDKAAMEELLEFYSPLIKAAIRKCIYSDSNFLRFKEDLKSMASLEFIKLVHSYDVSRSFFSYYISNRLYNNLIKSARTLVNKNENDLPVEVLFCEMPPLWDPENTDPFGQVELRIITLEAIKKLDEKYQDCINLVFYDQLNQEEASLKLGITQSAFSKRLKKSMSELKKILINNFDFME